MEIRKIQDHELGILEEMLYQALFQPEGVEPAPRTVIYQAEIHVFIDRFGQEKDDCCFVAEEDGTIIGAVWTRILGGEVKGYGHVDSETPEFAISLLEGYRNRGIGTLLMEHMIEWLKQAGYKKTSLSVNKDNYAVKMYRKLGFEVIEEREHDYLMVLALTDASKCN